jgi:hypothetical protein
MSRILIVVLFFAAVLVGFGLGALGVPTEYAIASGLIVTGAALVLGGRHERLKEALPVNLMVVGVAFVGVGALMAAGGACADDEDEAGRDRSTIEDVALQSSESGR